MTICDRYVIKKDDKHYYNLGQVLEMETPVKTAFATGVCTARGGEWSTFKRKSKCLGLGKK